jgi:hypothetical protein
LLPRPPKCHLPNSIHPISLLSRASFDFILHVWECSERRKGGREGRRERKKKEGRKEGRKGKKEKERGRGKRERKRERKQASIHVDEEGTCSPCVRLIGSGSD